MTPGLLAVDVKANRLYWLDALLSGEFVQGAGSLLAQQPNGTEKHCCLGVACDISGVAPRNMNNRRFWNVEVIEDVRIPENVRVFNNNWSEKINAVRDWLGISRKLVNEAINMNDSGQSFTEIADFFIRRWELEDEF